MKLLLKAAHNYKKAFPLLTCRSNASSASQFPPTTAVEQSLRKELFYDMVGKNLLTLQEVSNVQLENLLWSALDIKHLLKAPYGSAKLTHLLDGQSLALLFEKKSTRSRIAFESGAHHLGAHCIFCAKEDVHLGERESIRDTTEVMSRLTSAIVARVSEHSKLEEMARNAHVPIINALSDLHHPMQALADVMTIFEHFGRLKGLKIAWVGDGNNVLHSLLTVASKLKMSISVACPKGYEPIDLVKQYAKAWAKFNDTTVDFTNEPFEAVRDAHVIVTDTWVSMGQEDEREQRLADFEGFQVNARMLDGSAKNNWMFLHCSPRRADSREVDDELFYHAERSLVTQQAENHKWCAISVLVNLLKGYTPHTIQSRPSF